MSAALGAVRSVFQSRASLITENLALRQQLANLKLENPRPHLGLADRVFWVALSRVWSRWKDALAIVSPATVVRWHREGFRLFWRWKSRRRGRPPTEEPIRVLIRRIALANPTWGAPRIHGEMLKLGFDIAESTVAKYMPVVSTTPSPTWKTFLRLHLADSAGMDFFTIPTVIFGVHLYGFVIIRHRDRRILHLNVTRHPTAEWTKRQLLEAVPYDQVPSHLHRDRDRIYSEVVTEAIANLGITDQPSAPRSPWQNPYAERVIGSIRRDLLDHCIVLNEAHARRLLRAYQSYYHDSRTHLGLSKDVPASRPVQNEDRGADIIEIPQVFGLHHRYERRAA